jgi:trehalose 6-phosphate synthase
MIGSGSDRRRNLRSPQQSSDSGPPGADPAPDDGVVVVSNRQPYRHEWTDDEPTVSRPTGGLSEGLDSAVREINGSWVAWGDGAADEAVVDDDDCVAVPPDAPPEEQYTLKRIWLDEAQVCEYYYGFSNRVLWPVCHGMLDHVNCRQGYWPTYTEVNERFADAVASHTSAGETVWIQDYHFAQLPREVRARVPDDVFVAHFWHIPWPEWETFRACPHAEELLRGLLGNDLFGVHIPRYGRNFLECVDAGLSETRVDWDAGRIVHRGGETTVQAFPLGVDTDRIRDLAVDGHVNERWPAFADRHGVDDDVHLAVGVDRLDYTKGIPTRLEAIEQLFERHPTWQGDLTYVQVGTESRSQIPAYDRLQEQVTDAVDRINGRFGDDDWQPVVYTTDRLSNEMLYALYRRADTGVVTPLRDGMNLVAQEFVSAQAAAADPGVLVLSDQAGAHDFLGDDAVTVTPCDTTSIASGLEVALSMPVDERRRRMDALAQETRRHDVTDWITDVLGSVAQVRDEGASVSTGSHA